MTAPNRRFYITPLTVRYFLRDMVPAPYDDLDDTGSRVGRVDNVRRAEPRTATTREEVMQVISEHYYARHSGPRPCDGGADDPVAGYVVTEYDTATGEIIDCLVVRADWTG